MQTKIGYNYSFNENACATCGGACCIGESGAIWLNSEESRAIANFLKIEHEDFCLTYAKKIDGRLSIKEKPYKDGWACIFFNEGCEIYSVRPKQCATFPFWEKFISEPQLLCCPGVCSQ